MAEKSTIVEDFIERWRNSTGGAERANYAMFLTEFCAIISVAPPDPAGHEADGNAYAFERGVTFREAGERTGHGRIDLYKRGSFVLEAKQSRWRDGAKAIPGQSDLFNADTDKPSRGRADRRWDVLMLNARRQAESYARALPSSEGWPPFILVCDVGHCIEVFADFSGTGKDYRQFPDRSGFRIFLEDLRDEAVRKRLKAIWDEPHSLDPTRASVRATREIARRLAEVSKRLEAKGENAEDVAAFLMRCLFTMFAEDMELLPKDSFTELLDRCIEKPEIFPRHVKQLWQAMDKGDFAYGIDADVRRFNGNLFHGASVIPLDREDIGVLKSAAVADWREVDPSIFGTLLEQALSAADRSRLGAHYTPRADVERLVTATVMEPLLADWSAVEATAERLMIEGDREGAIKVVRDFHEKLFNTRVLDPACGTGNFLYVSLELMKRLEGKVLEALADLGGQEALRGLDRHEVDPHQFLGIELNTRARHIAELVLWIGFLQWHKRNRGELPGDPVLKDYGNISQGDAVLTWDGYPVPKVEDGKETLPNARRPDWPQAEFIVGNPPFIGKGSLMREALGDTYVEALWKAHREMNESADFVMYWWDRAAELLTRKGTVLRRFGFVTTNSITQVFNRRVVARHLNAKNPVSLVMAIGDHPWTKATKDSASVRIAMTVAEAAKRDGVVYEVTNETGLDTDEPETEMKAQSGMIHADLTVGANVTAAKSLQANAGMSCNGMMLAGRGFVLTKSEADHLKQLDGPGTESIIRPFINGGELVRSWSRRFVIDLFGLDEETARKKYPAIFQHLLTNVKPERQKSRDKAFKSKWWLFGRSRPQIREGNANIDRFIGTTETSKHRLFQFLSTDVLPDHMIIAIASDNAFHLGVLSSKWHVMWAIRSGGWLGYGNDPRYSKSRCFDPFPFPDPDEKIRGETGALAEEIDAHRKRAQDQHGITLTQMYNVLEKLRAGEALEPDDERIHDQALISTLKHLHDQLDAAVARAYGWPEDLAQEEVLARLVALNAERAKEERAGKVRWLRPDYQVPRFGSPKEKAQLEAELEGADASQAVAAGTKKPAFPKSDLDQTLAVTFALARADAPLSAADIARQFSQGRRVEKQVAFVLRALIRMGEVSSADGGRSFTIRRAA